MPAKGQHNSYYWGRARSTKYGNTRVEWDGMKFDSKKELNRYCVLCDFEKAGLIHNLRRQVKYELSPTVKTPSGTTLRGCSYIADFVYEDKDGNTVVEDCKSEITRKDKSYIVKKKWMYNRYGIEIIES